MTPVHRRTLLAVGGATAVGAVVGGFGIRATRRESGEPEPTPTETEPATFARWRANRKAPYYIGHRGAGDVAPEHTLPGYLAALDWGAEVLEISVVMSADQVLFCHHDLTLDRTTTLQGPVADKPASVIDTARVRIPRLGPRWAGAEMPVVPRLTDVLAAVGRRAVLAVEAKDDSAYPFLVRAITEAGLRDSVMLKVLATSGRLEMAKAERFPVFAYLGNVQVATAAAIDTVAKKLDPATDALILPCQDGNGLFSTKLVLRAVNTSVPIWMAPVHRRSEVQHFSELGATGFVTPDLGYLSGSEPKRRFDQWSTGSVGAGELTRDPYSNAYTLTWDPTEAALGLDFPGRPAFVTFGNFGPVESDSYRVVFDAMFEQVPEDTYEHVSIAFGHADDQYYEHRLGLTDGFHAILRGDGGMAIFTHRAGQTFGKRVSLNRASTPLRDGLWSRLTLDVTPQLIRWSRDDGTSVETSAPDFRGGYFHIGRSSVDGPLKLRNLSVS